MQVITNDLGVITKINALFRDPHDHPVRIVTRATALTQIGAGKGVGDGSPKSEFADCDDMLLSEKSSVTIYYMSPVCFAKKSVRRTPCMIRKQKLSGALVKTCSRYNMRWRHRFRTRVIAEGSRSVALDSQTLTVRPIHVVRMRKSGGVESSRFLFAGYIVPVQQ